MFAMFPTTTPRRHGSSTAAGPTGYDARKDAESTTPERRCHRRPGPDSSLHPATELMPSAWALAAIERLEWDGEQLVVDWVVA